MQVILLVEKLAKTYLKIYNKVGKLNYYNFDDGLRRARDGKEREIEGDFVRLSGLVACEVWLKK